MSGGKATPTGAALVTGGAKRIGRAFAEAMAADGRAVAIHYNTSADEAESLAAEINASGGRAAAVRAELSDPAAAEALVDSAAQALGPVAVLINSASVFEEDGPSSVIAESFHKHMDVNALAPMLVSKAFAAQAPAGASIFNLLDYKVFNINADFYSYTVSKFALKAVTEMLARALAPDVRVNAAAPGLTLPSPYHTQSDFDRLHNDNPLECGPTPDDLVRTLRYFLETPSVTGQILAVDGGQHFDRRLTRDVFGALGG